MCATTATTPSRTRHVQCALAPANDSAARAMTTRHLYSMPAPPPSTAEPLTPSTAEVRPYRWFGGSATRRRPRRTLVRVVLALTTSSALLVVAALVGAAVIVPPIGARRIARDAAQRESRGLLEADEVVAASTFAAQRRWTDLWRESNGMLIATNKGLLYVSAPPMPLLRPHDDGPQELLIARYPYDSAFALAPRARFRGLERGLVLHAAEGQLEFSITDDQWRWALDVVRASDEMRGAARAAASVRSTDSIARRPIVK